ncbi:bestrophin homolog 24-like isoform X3 [Cherax quadricarinatus]|uniref:bestrophin homolog 24-like isoform X3 n=1 Tax=Cherax quadricarinatus TaxID=27406 RepID=UPI00387E510B
MTVSYQYDVASSTSGGFTRLLFKWKGSLYKLIYRELFLFCLGYACMSCIYRFVFTEPQKRRFEVAVLYCDTYMNYIPLSFILGFYVSFVASRWWQQYMAIPWPDKIIHAIALHITGYDDKGRMMRRTLARYINLSLVLILRSISSPLKKRFPTLDHLVEAGFITSTELGIYKLVPNKEFNTYWVPCTWFTALLKDIKAQKRIPDPMGVKHIMEEFLEFRAKCGLLWCYDWVSIPLVYTQVVTIATYAFFLAAIVGRQFVEKSPYAYKAKLDLYIPFFTILQFFFYMGLLKVAEQLINPFGDDDEDFELNWIIDRHMKVSYLIVDTLLLRTPPLSRDIFYDDESPVLPYTEASAEFKKRTYRGSVANMVIPEDKQNLILPDIEEEGEDEERRPSSNLTSQHPSVMSSVNNVGGGSHSGTRPDTDLGQGELLAIHQALSNRSFLEGSKDLRSLSVPDDGLTLVGRSSSPYATRRESSKSAPLSRSSSRRTGTAGSKGIGSALLAVGAHQGFLAADPEKVSQASLVAPSTEGAAKESDDMDRVFLPFSNWASTIDNGDSVTLDMGSIADEEDTQRDDKNKPKVKSTFRLPASLKSRLAVRKKPVITWRPYTRQVSVAQGLPQVLPENFPEFVETEIPEEIKAAMPSNLPPGHFEDECAFMWRTIDNDSDSMKTANSAMSDDHHHSDIWLHDTAALSLSQYKDVKPQFPEVQVEEYGLPKEQRVQRLVLYRPLGARRARYKTRGRMRCQTCSMPLLTTPRRRVSILPSLVRSLSENSVFLEAVVRRLSEHNRSQEKPYPSSKRQQLTLPVPPSSLTVNGRHISSSPGSLDSH